MNNIVIWCISKLELHLIRDSALKIYLTNTIIILTIMNMSSPFYIARKSKQSVVFDQYDLCMDCHLDKLCLLSGLDKQSFNQFEKCISGKVLIEAGQYLYQQGEPLKYLYWLENGLIKNSLLNGDGIENIDMFYFPEELIGLDSLHSGFHPFDYVAVRKSSLFLISFTEFQSLCMELPDLQNNLMKLFAHEIKKRNSFNLNFNNPLKVRYASFLIDCYEKKAVIDNITLNFELNIPIHDMASYLEISEETLEQLIYEFKQKGILKVKNQTITINNVKALYSIANI